MKDKLLIIISTAFVTILLVGLYNAFGYGSYHMGNYDNNRFSNYENNTHNRGMMNYNKEKNYNNSQMHCNENGLDEIAAQDLNDAEKNLLNYQYSEEKLARDVYQKLAQKYDINIFKNISSSEQKHMDELNELFVRYNLTIPEGYGELTTKYEELVNKGNIDLKNAIEVGISIEKLDIDDIKKDLEKTDNNDVKYVLNNLLSGSYNHINSFVKILNKNGYTTNIDYSNYLK